jgi:hypothetical protein
MTPQQPVHPAKVDAGANSRPVWLLLETSLVLKPVVIQTSNTDGADKMVNGGSPPR